MEEQVWEKDEGFHMLNCKRMWDTYPGGRGYMAEGAQESSPTWRNRGGAHQYLVVTRVQGNKKAIQKNKKQETEHGMIRKEKGREPRIGS